MKKSGIIIIAILGVLVFFGFKAYNSLVTIDEKVEKYWSDVQNMYQRRADVYSAQLDIVKGAAKNEKDILIGVTEARSGITKAKEGMSNAQTPAELDQYLAQAKQAALSINVQIEAYPEVRSTEAFLNFQNEVNGSENRITTARADYNKKIEEYNAKVRKMPTALFAGAMGFDKRERFKSQEGADVAPDLGELSE